RPHDAEPPGPRRRHAVPLRDLLSFRGAEADRGGSDRGAGGREGLGHADRDRGRAAGRVLPRRGVPPRVLPAAPGAGVLPRGDRAEAGEGQEGVRGAAEGGSGACARAPLFAHAEARRTRRFSLEGRGEGEGGGGEGCFWFAGAVETSRRGQRSSWFAPGGSAFAGSARLCQARVRAGPGTLLQGRARSSCAHEPAALHWPPSFPIGAAAWPCTRGAWT